MKSYPSTQFFDIYVRGGGGKGEINPTKNDQDRDLGK
jgi:hypothetical protein